MRANRTAFCIGLVLLVFGFVSTVLAQTATGTLTGTVTDAQGAAMVGVMVTVRNTDTGVDQKPVPTNESGIYTASLLQPGNYDITASQTGFATVQRKAIPVQVGSTVRIDIQMPVAGQQSLVTVTEEVPLIETEKTDASQTISENLVSNLPTSSRRWEQFALLTPGVNFDGASGVSIHGINSMYNSNAVDGADNNSEYNSSARGGTNDGYTYSADSIREFQVGTGNFTADTGHSAGSAVNAVTRSGGNNLHGDVFYNMRNPIFNAVDPAAGVKPVNQQNQFGGSVGGPFPFLKDKLFYFVTYDGFRKETPITFTSTTPIGSLACPNPTTIASAQCAAAINYLLTQEMGTFPRLLRQDVALGKIDYQVNQANHVNATFNWRNWQQPDGTSFATSNNTGLSNALNSYIYDRFLIGSWNTVMGGDKVNQLLYQYGSDTNFSIRRPGSILPTVTVSQIFDYGSYLPDPTNQPHEQRHEFADTLSFGKGRHAFKVGADIQILQQNSRSGNPASGAYVYSSTVALPAAVTASGGCAPTVIAISQTTNTLFCDWLVDLFGYNTGANTGQHYTSFSQTRDIRFPGNTNGVPLGLGDQYTHGQYSAYFQDSWKLRPNVTVNLGVRYDVQQLPGQTNPNDGSPLLAYYTTIQHTDYGGVQPRAGIAWNLAKNTVLRVGAGIFFANQGFQTISSTRRSTGAREGIVTCAPGSGLCASLLFPSDFYSQSATLPSTLPITGLPPGQQPVPALVTNPPGNACAVITACSVRALDPGILNPRVVEGLVALERQLPGNIALTASYNFTRGTHLPLPWDSNVAPATVTKTYDVVNANGATQSTATVPFYTTRLDPAGSIEVFHSAASSWYNGMELTVQKRASHGFEFLTSYTLSYATDNGQETVSGGEGSFSSLGVVDPYNMRAEQGRSALDVRNHFTGSLIWTPTFAMKLSNRVARGALDGWSLSGIVTAANGAPYPAAISTSGIQCSDARTPNTAGLCPATTITGITIPAGISGLDGGMAATDLDTSSAPQGGRASFLPRAAANLPGYHNLDVRLSRSVSITERFKVEVRGEVFNAFNSTMVQAVSTGAYTLVQPSSTSTTCNIATHTNTCVVPSATWGKATTTSANFLGARQMQFGFRFEF